MRQESIRQRFPAAFGLLDEQQHQQVVNEELDHELALLRVAYSDFVVKVSSVLNQAKGRAMNVVDQTHLGS